MNIYTYQLLNSNYGTAAQIADMQNNSDGVVDPAEALSTVKTNTPQFKGTAEEAFAILQKMVSPLSNYRTININQETPLKLPPGQTSGQERTLTAAENTTAIVDENNFVYEAIVAKNPSPSLKTPSPNRYGLTPEVNVLEKTKVTLDSNGRVRTGTFTNDGPIELIKPNTSGIHPIINVKGQTSFVFDGNGLIRYCTVNNKCSLEKAPNDYIEIPAESTVEFNSQGYVIKINNQGI